MILISLLKNPRPLLVRLRAGLLVALIMGSAAGCAHLRFPKLKFSRDKQKPPATVAVAPRFMGTIALVNESLGFVLIDFSSGALPARGQALKSFSGEAESAVVAVSGESKAPFAVADIVKGKPLKGDAVYE